MVVGSGVILEGWLYREEQCSGSMTTWKKRWSVLSIQKIQIFKHNLATEPITTLSVASIEEMAFGNNLTEGSREFVFTLTTPRGVIRISAESEELRQTWVESIRALVPKAKLELAKEMLMRKAKRKANLELAQQQYEDAIESIMRDSKRIGVKKGFKAYADALAEYFVGLLSAVDLVTDMGLSCAKSCAHAVSAVVNGANATAAICTNKAVQQEIVVRTRHITLETANLLGYATTASHDQISKVKMFECVETIQDQVQQILELLASVSDIQNDIDLSREHIEQCIESNFTSAPILREDASVESGVDLISEKAKIFTTTIKNIANTAFITPERVGQYSKDVSDLCCELIDATSIVAYCSGVDVSSPEYIAGTLDIDEAKRMQIETLLAAAKGFAAATSGMIDLLKQVPEQEDDEGVQLKINQSIKSTDNALNAFLFATNNIELPNSNQFAGNFSIKDLVDPEIELHNAFDEIEASVSKLGSSGNVKSGYRNKGSTSVADYDYDSNDGSFDEIQQAAWDVGDTTKQLMSAAIEVQKEIKRTEGADVFKKDPNWALALIDSTKAVSETTCQLVELALDSNTSPEELIASARCVVAASSSLVDISKAKGNPNSGAHRNLEEISRSLARVANHLVDVCKNKNAEGAADDFDAIRASSLSAQMKSEYEAQTRIAKLEAELEAARDYLEKVRKVLRGVAN